MPVIIKKQPEQKELFKLPEDEIDIRKRRVIYNVVKHLGNLAKTSVLVSSDFKTITILNGNRHVPDYTFQWCGTMNHYRVYMHMVLDSEKDKERIPYTAFIVPSALVASLFTVVYNFFHKYRGANKTELAAAA